METTANEILSVQCEMTHAVVKWLLNLLPKIYRLCNFRISSAASDPSYKGKEQKRHIRKVAAPLVLFSVSGPFLEPGIKKICPHFGYRGMQCEWNGQRSYQPPRPTVEHVMNPSFVVRYKFGYFRIYVTSHTLLLYL